MPTKRQLLAYVTVLTLFCAVAYAGQRGGGTTTTSQGQRGATPTQSQPGTPNSGINTAQTQQQNGTISGSVSQVGTGVPIKKATITIRRLPDENAAGGTVASADSFGTTQGGRGNFNGGGGGGGSRTAQTDVNGMYTITGVAAGRYRLTASASGFVTHDFGAPSFDASGTPISVTANGTVNADFQLLSGGLIEGTVMDEDGAPMVSAQLQLYEANYDTGQRMLVPRQTAQTNDLGQYRIPSLDPGNYYLAAAPSADQAILPPDTAVAQSVSGGDRGRGNPGQGGQQQGRGGRGGGRSGRGGQPTATATNQTAPAPPVRAYPPTFFPGSTDASQAVALELAPGFEAHGIDIMLRPVTLVTIRGTVIAPVGIPLTNQSTQQQQQQQQQNRQNNNQNGGAGRGAGTPSQGGAGTQNRNNNLGGATGATGGRGNDFAAQGRGGGGRGGQTQGGQNQQNPNTNQNQNQNNQQNQRGGRNGGGRGGQGGFPNDFTDPASGATVILMPIGVQATVSGRGGGGGGGGRNGPGGGGPPDFQGGQPGGQGGPGGGGGRGGNNGGGGNP
ncbi:MAG TPA: carboxypeptidase-like regulatory domain-containing protein, partial [Terriglobia bacterium]|nr:carboxypeptidase-like regulatory domain-containing protein [Terriglobia bacterium]